MQSVSKTYAHRGKTIKALDNVTLEFPPGDFVAVVGPSGSGKSTLLLTLGGMLRPATGQVCVDGQSIYELDLEDRAVLRRRRMGFVFQTFNLVPYLSAQENVQVPLLLAGADDARQGQTSARLLERLGLGDRLDHKPSELSVGQQQRVALARMLANDPEIVLADEPTGNLDPETSQAILAFLEEINREGRTIVMVTHDMRIAAKAKRVLRLVDGGVVSDGPSGGPVGTA